MYSTWLVMLLVLGQPVLRDSGPARPGTDPNTRRAVLPGKPEPRLQPIDGFSCRTFLGYSEDQTHFNLATGDKACSGEVLSARGGGFRQVNYLPTPVGALPVLIFSPTERIDAASRIVLYLNGGPRSLVTERPLAQQMVAKGYTVLMPIYLGELETLHPAPDLPGAVQQIRALTHWAGKRLVATVGVSTGAYLAAAACTVRCAPRILLAPPLTTPEDGLSDTRVEWEKITEGSCIWRYNGPNRVCSDMRPFLTSFWGSRYYRTSLARLLRRQCDRVRILVSSDDERVYDPKGVADLRAIGCTVETPPGYAHAQVDAAPALNDRTLDLIAQHDPRRARDGLAYSSR
ncbi:alpha/beta hydrolase family protein [Sphingomonas sp. Leaf4]|uniref:alpha/beta hydrolase family protein n=1 Tax=Sphingomonas sp. Leaf4 TaxID=2876553 RepID=UPI001E51D012|nr:hypothetical protein [Sphingomonas sp. Leaf4]